MSLSRQVLSACSRQRENQDLPSSPLFAKIRRSSVEMPCPGRKLLWKPQRGKGWSQGNLTQKIL